MGWEKNREQVMRATINFQTALLTRKQRLLSDLQTRGLRLIDPKVGAASRIGGAGPTDHKAITILGTTIMVPVHTRGATSSPYVAMSPDTRGISLLLENDATVCEISFPPQPNFYALTTKDGIPYWKIAQLHSRDTLATTVLQTCVRYGNSTTKCQFCAIGESLKGGRTIARKTPEQLAEVSAAAHQLDGIRNVVMTTGTPPTDDRGLRCWQKVPALSKSARDCPFRLNASRPMILSGFKDYAPPVSTRSACISKRGTKA